MHSKLRVNFERKGGRQSGAFCARPRNGRVEGRNALLQVVHVLRRDGARLFRGHTWKMMQMSTSPPGRAAAVHYDCRKGGMHQRAEPLWPPAHEKCGKNAKLISKQLVRAANRSQSFD